MSWVVMSMFEMFRSKHQSKNNSLNTSQKRSESDTPMSEFISLEKPHGFIKRHTSFWVKAIPIRYYVKQKRIEYS